MLKFFRNASMATLWMAWALLPFAQVAGTYSLTSVGPMGPTVYSWPTVFQPLGFDSQSIFWDQGLFSPDGGETWKSVRPQLPGFINWAQEDRSAPQFLYVSYDPGPFARSSDGGESFQIIQEPFGLDIVGGKMAQDSTGRLYLLAGDGAREHLYTSSDRGLNWERVQIKQGRNRIEKRGVGRMWADPVLPGFLYAYDHGDWTDAFLVSTDGGKNWRARMDGLPPVPKALLFHNLAQSTVPPYTLYATVSQSHPSPGEQVKRFAYSRDRGKHWRIIRNPQRLTVNAQDVLAVKPGTQDHLFTLVISAAGDTGATKWLMASEDGGKTWERRGSILPSGGWTDAQLCGWGCTDQTVLFRLGISSANFAKNGNLLLSSTPPGFLLSRDSGNTFEVHNGGASGRAVASLLQASDGTLYAGGGLYGFLWASDTQGETWRFIELGPSDFLCEGPSGAIYGGGGNVYEYIGGTVTRLLAGSVDMLALYVEGGEEIFLFSSSVADDVIGFYRSRDRFVTWEQAGTLNGLIGISALLPDPRDPRCVLVAGWAGDWCWGYQAPYDPGPGAVFRSDDGGATWTQVQGGLNCGSVTAMYRDKINPDLVVLSASGKSQGLTALGGIFISLDGGVTWERRSEGLPSFGEDGWAPRISALISPPSGETLFAAVQVNGGFYRSDDLGRTWSKVAELPVAWPQNLIDTFLCDLKIWRRAVTEIIPLEDGLGSFLAATQHGGLFKGTPQARAAISVADLQRRATP